MKKAYNLQELTNDLHKLQINNNFDLWVSKKYVYNFPNEKIFVKGFGYYDTNEPKRRKGPRKDHRYYLEFNIDGRTNGNIITAIMMNPSNTFPASKNKKSTIDFTVKNVIRMAYQLGKYSKIVILNSFALIDGNGAEAHSDNQSLQKKNLDIIEAYIKENKDSDYLLAWGNNAEDTDKIRNFLKNNISENKILVYKTTKNGNYPCHPSIRVENSYKYVSDFLNTHNKNDSFEVYKL